MAAFEADSVVKLAHDLPIDEDTGDSLAEAVAGESGNVTVTSTSKPIRKTADVQIDERGADFESFMLKEAVLKGLKRANYVRPSPIQLKAIPVGRIGLDMVVQAKSGTGKTCVFTVLALEIVESANPAPQVLIIAPTREIALQITDALSTIGFYLLEKKENEFTGVKTNTSGIKVECFIGGTALHLDKDKARLQKCQIVVGTPGRILQLINEGDLSIDAVRLFVLDEADKLMQESYQSDVNSIYAHLPSGKQLVVTSATYPRQLDEFLSRYMKTPTFVELDSADVQLLGVKQYLLTSTLHREDKGQHNGNDFESWIDRKIEIVDRLLSRICFNQCLIFCAFQDKVEALAKKLLTLYKWPAAYIASNLNQTQRTSVLRRLQNFQIRVLVSTDLTARGIDAENVNLVINFDLPYDAESYFHRIGRAGRFGGYGSAITLTFNKTEEMKFYTMAAQNAFQVKKLPAINEIPNNLAENENYYAELPEMEFPNAETINRYTAKQEKYRKPKQQRQRRSDQKATAGTAEVDEYTKLIQSAGPVERWSPTEFVWEGKSDDYRTSNGATNGSRREYSRSEMLDILKDTLSSMPPSRASIATSQSPPERESSQDTAEQPEKGQRIDVSALFSYFQGSPEPDQKTATYFPSEMSQDEFAVDRQYAEEVVLDQEKPTLESLEKPSTSEVVGASVERVPPTKKYDREELLTVRPLCNLAYAETVFNMSNLLRTFKKKGKKKRLEEAPLGRKYTREEMLTMRPLGGLAHTEKISELWKSSDTFENKKKKRAAKGTESGPTTSVAVLPRPAEKAKPVDIRKDYDEAVSHAAQSPFYQFFGGCALKLQAFAVEARKAREQTGKEVQTDEFIAPVTPPIRKPGWKTVSYGRDQMLEMWKTVANASWSFKRRQYPWIGVLGENGLLVDRKYGEEASEGQNWVLEDEEDGEQEEMEEEEEEEEEDARDIISEYKETLAEYREVLKLYKKTMAKHHM